ncbi:hypothetical protein LTR74_010119 [Friedmanniomyces endolithicus]|nr:hypothetical protein LTR74_010119 [Friedmanniomyces endolithicus]
MDLGPLASGGEQLLGHILGGHLYSEPGFEPHFSGTVKYAEDYLTSDANGAYARPSCLLTVVPDNGVDLPFLMEIHGVQKAVPSLDIIFAGNTTGLQGRENESTFVRNAWADTLRSRKCRTATRTQVSSAIQRIERKHADQM